MKWFLILMSFLPFGYVPGVQEGEIGVRSPIVKSQCLLQENIQSMMDCAYNADLSSSRVDTYSSCRGVLEGWSAKETSCGMVAEHIPSQIRAAQRETGLLENP